MCCHYIAGMRNGRGGGYSASPLKSGELENIYTPINSFSQHLSPDLRGRHVLILTVEQLGEHLVALIMICGLMLICHIGSANRIDLICLILVHISIQRWSRSTSEMFLLVCLWRGSCGRSQFYEHFTHFRIF